MQNQNLNKLFEKPWRVKSDMKTLAILTVDPEQAENVLEMKIPEDKFKAVSQLSVAAYVCAIHNLRVDKPTAKDLKELPSKTPLMWWSVDFARAIQNFEFHNEAYSDCLENGGFKTQFSCLLDQASEVLTHHGESPTELQTAVLRLGLIVLKMFQEDSVERDGKTETVN